MTEESPTIDSRRAIGQALARLRERAGKTQEQLAEAMDISPQYVGQHENGKVKGIVAPEVQARFLRAIGATADDLEEELRGTTGESSAPSRVARMAREIMGNRTQATRQATFPTNDGDVVITFPAHLTPAGFKQLESYFAVFISLNSPANSH